MFLRYSILCNFFTFSHFLIFSHFPDTKGHELMMSWIGLHKFADVIFEITQQRLYITSLTFFFYQGFLSQTLTTHRTAGEGRGPFLFHSTTSTHSQTDIYLQPCMWDDYHIFFNRNACIYQTATRWDFIHLLPAILIRETGGLELTSTVTLVLQVNQLTKCASHPKFLY